MRLIDADDLLAKVMIDAPGFMDGGSEITKAFIMAMINTRSVTPTIDAVPVVRCKDCMHRNDIHKCQLLEGCGGHEADDWFCADGKRKVV